MPLETKIEIATERPEKNATETVVDLIVSDELEPQTEAKKEVSENLVCTEEASPLANRPRSVTEEPPVARVFTRPNDDGDGASIEKRILEAADPSWRKDVTAIEGKTRRVVVVSVLTAIEELDVHEDPKPEE